MGIQSVSFRQHGDIINVKAITDLSEYLRGKNLKLSAESD